jgi:CRISPR type III-B/RAMP module RAMP protein Cmr6
MPTLMPRNTRVVFEELGEQFDSRSLLFDRLIYDHPTMDEARRFHFARLCRSSYGWIDSQRADWQAEHESTQREQDRRRLRDYLDDTALFARRRRAVGPANAESVCASRQAYFEVLGAGVLLYGQVRSRLMLNMAGGVMENAGLCLDRFGLPYIPGSAVKGCARRAALAALREWCEAGGQTHQKPCGPDNPLTAACEKFEAPSDLLAAIAPIFGWSEHDWQSNSDFAWACSDVLWGRIYPQVVKQLNITTVKDSAGSVSLLPAFPVSLGRTGQVDGLPLAVPEVGTLELDVLTCHHREYYDGKPDFCRHDNLAPDTEEPVPVVFPAVAPGHVFAFAVAPVRGSHKSDPQIVEHARTWLKTGLETFGIGAKTNAGYGWFDCSKALQDSIAGLRRQQLEVARQAAAKLKADEEAAARARAEADRLAKAPAHERFQAEYSKLGDEPFAAQAKKYAEMTDAQRHGFILALRARRDTAKRWSKKKPDLLKPWQEHAQKFQPPVQLP